MSTCALRLDAHGSSDEPGASLPHVPGCEAWNPRGMKRKSWQTRQCKAFEVAALARSSVLFGGHPYGLGHVMHHAASHSAAMYVNVPKGGSNEVKIVLQETGGNGTDHIFVGEFGEKICEVDGKQQFCGCHDDEHEVPQQSIPLFYYSFVRDPLDRFISAFYEMHIRDRVHDKQWSNVGISPYDAGEDAKKMEGAVQRLEALVAYLESGGHVDDEHMTAQTVFFQKWHSSLTDYHDAKQSTGSLNDDIWNCEIRNQLLHGDMLDAPWEFEMLSLDYVGQTQCMTEGLADVIRAVNSSEPLIFKQDSIDIVGRTAPANVKSEVSKRLFWAAMNGTLRQRVCDLYWVDYCCLNLPVPSECKIKSCPA